MISFTDSPIRVTFGAPTELKIDFQPEVMISGGGTPPPSLSFTVAHGLANATGTPISGTEQTINATSAVVSYTSVKTTTASRSIYFTLPASRNLSAVRNRLLGSGADITSQWTRVTGTKRYYYPIDVAGAVVPLAIVTTS